MKKLLLLFLLVVSHLHIKAQLDSLPLVKVTGEYALKVRPDYVVLGVSINKTLSTDIKMSFRIFEKEDTRIRLFDFDEKDITETLIRFKKNDTKLVYIKDIFITVKNTAKLDEILLELHKQGFTNYRYVEYRVNNLKELKDKAKVEAIKLAREKAIMMAAALGQTIGAAHTIEELDTPIYNWYDIAEKVNENNLPSILNNSNYLFDPGYIVVLSKVKVNFELLKQ